MRLRRDADAGLKPRLYFILLALAETDRHGLAIAREVGALSDGQVRLWPATLYGSLDELHESGWIDEVDDPRERPPEESDKAPDLPAHRSGPPAARQRDRASGRPGRLASARIKPRRGRIVTAGTRPVRGPLYRGS